jgi:hypothetical protein
MPQHDNGAGENAEARSGDRVCGMAEHPAVQTVTTRFEEASRGRSVVFGSVASMPDQDNPMIARGSCALSVDFNWLLLQWGTAAINGVTR